MRTAHLLPVLPLALACGGLLGYGAEIASTPVQDNVPFVLTYTASNGDPHQLWLDYDVSAAASTYQVSGPLEVKVNGASVASHRLDLTPQGAPIVGESGRFTMNNVETSLGGSTSARGTIWLVELPPQPAGTLVELSGTWAATSPTVVNSFRLVVTDTP